MTRGFDPATEAALANLRERDYFAGAALVEPPDRTKERRCPECSKPFRMAATGRPRRYCSTKCRNAANYRERTTR